MMPMARRILRVIYVGARQLLIAVLVLSFIVGLGDYLLVDYENITETLLTKGFARDYGLGSFDEFAVAPNGAIVVGGEGHLTDLLTRAKLLDDRLEALSSFAFLDDGTLAVVADDNLGFLAKDRFQPGPDLPFRRMRLAKGRPGELLLFSGSTEPRGNRASQQARANEYLYGYYEGGRTALLLRAPAVITAATAGKDVIYFASQGAIFAYDDEGNLLLMAGLPGGEVISSLAFSRKHEALFFTVNSDLYLLANGIIMLVREGAGEQLIENEGWLYVFNSGTGHLARSELSGGPGFLKIWFTVLVDWASFIVRPLL